MKTTYNFNAGPCILPKEAIKAGIEALQDFNNSGMSVIEISHRSKDWEAVMDECRALWKELLQIPDDYEVLFLGGGASLQFCMVPMNLLNKKAAYLETGVWAKKAIKEAKAGEVVTVALRQKARSTISQKIIRSLPIPTISILQPITPSTERKFTMIWTVPFP